MKAFVECGLCKRKFESRSSESAGRAARRHRLVSASFDAGNESFEMYFCRDCYDALRHDRVETKKAARVGESSSHVYMPASMAGKEVVIVYKGAGAK